MCQPRANVPTHHYYYYSFLGKWLKLSINTKERPPPSSFFSLTLICNGTAVLFGGLNPVQKTNQVYIVKFAKTAVVIKCIKIIVMFYH